MLIGRASVPSTWRASVGGQLRLLRRDAITWSISPDGSTAAFGTNDEREMWLMGVTGGNLRELADAGGNNWYSHIQWSPDGLRLLYIKYIPAGGRVQRLIETRDMRGGAGDILLSEQGLHSLTWLRDGRILFVKGETNQTGGSCQYWAGRLNDKASAFLSKPQQLTHGITFCISSTSVTADGKRLFFLKQTSEFSVYVADLAPGASRISPPKHLTLTRGRQDIKTLGERFLRFGTLTSFSTFPRYQHEAVRGGHAYSGLRQRLARKHQG